ncbi:hypothetical protein [Pseudomonas viridiflava]|nr:hypothetical protein [Pseudomonas viridiflava]
MASGQATHLSLTHRIAGKRAPTGPLLLRDSAGSGTPGDLPQDCITNQVGELLTCRPEILAMTQDNKIRFLFPHMTNGRDKSLFVIFPAVSCSSFLEALVLPSN